MDKKEYNKELWEEVLNLGKKKERRIANTLDINDIKTIIGTMEFFGASDNWIKQSIFDLRLPKYRVFDWLCMCIMGRNDDNRTENNTSLKVLVYSYLKVNGDVEKFIEDLRLTDYDIVRDWEAINIDLPILEVV